MELERTSNIQLADGRIYEGWGFFNGEEFIPNGCGKKYYNNYYTLGNFINGVLDGPAIVSYDYCMYTMQFKNNRGNGWGLSINSGTLIEFGYYKDSKLVNNVLDFVLWYFVKMQKSERKTNMLNVFMSKDTHEVSDLLIGYKGFPVQEDYGLTYMGFHFMTDGSVWVGNTSDRNFTGNLLHFCTDGTIECGSFDDGNIIEPMELQDMIDIYYGTSNVNIMAALLSLGRNKNSIRDQFRNVPPIKRGYSYFTDGL